MPYDEQILRKSQHHITVYSGVGEIPAAVRSPINLVHLLPDERERRRNVIGQNVDSLYWARRACG